MSIMGEKGRYLRCRFRTADYDVIGQSIVHPPNGFSASPFTTGAVRKAPDISHLAIYVVPYMVVPHTFKRKYSSC